MSNKNKIWVACDDAGVPQIMCDSIEELADACGVKPSAIECYISRGKKDPHKTRYYSVENDLMDTSDVDRLVNQAKANSYKEGLAAGIKLGIDYLTDLQKMVKEIGNE